MLYLDSVDVVLKIVELPRVGGVGVGGILKKKKYAFIATFCFLVLLKTDIYIFMHICWAIFIIYIRIMYIQTNMRVYWAVTPLTRLL